MSLYLNHLSTDNNITTQNEESNNSKPYKDFCIVALVISSVGIFGSIIFFIGSVYENNLIFFIGPFFMMPFCLIGLILAITYLVVDYNKHLFRCTMVFGLAFPIIIFLIFSVISYELNKTKNR